MLLCLRVADISQRSIGFDENTFMMFVHDMFEEYISRDDVRQRHQVT